MRRIICIGLALSALTCLGAACDDDDDDTTVVVPGRDAAQAPVDASNANVINITLHGEMFDPMTVNVRRGETVRWTNDDGENHTVTSGESSSSSDAGQVFDVLLHPGEHFDYVFAGTQDLPYFCRIHEHLGMKGTLIWEHN